jgi:hypothetical protein
MTEGVGIYEVIVSNLIDNVVGKLGHALFGRLITGVVIESGFVGSLPMTTNDCRGVVSNCLVIERATSRVYKFGTMVGSVLDSLGEAGCEGVNSIQLVIGDDHEQWEKGFLDG